MRKALAVACLLTLSACSSSVPSPAPSPSTGSSPTAVGLHQIAPGTCLAGDKLEGSEPKVAIVPCTSPHRIEVYAVSDASVLTPQPTGSAPPDYPGKAALEPLAEKFCHDAFTSFVGLDVKASKHDFEYFYPSPASWSALKDRTVTCALIAAENVSTSLKDAKQ